MDGNETRQVMQDLERVLAEQILDLKPAPEVPTDMVPFQELHLDGAKKDNDCWQELLKAYLVQAKTFELHCWNEETEWIELALQYGTLKEDDWQYGKIITGL